MSAEEARSRNKENIFMGSDWLIPECEGEVKNMHIVS
jgi:hypothetical protein